MKIRRALLPYLRALLLLAGLALALIVPGERAVRAAPVTVSVSMSNPACVQVAPQSGACQIVFGYLSATGSDASFSRMEVRVDSKLRARMTGFFETSAYMNTAMLNGGLQVACGGPNSGGDPNFGKLYSVRLDGFMSGGENSWAQANVYCPYYDGKVYIPIVTR